MLFSVSKSVNKLITNCKELLFPKCNLCTSTSFDVEDAFSLNSQLDQDEKVIRDVTRNFCETKLMKRIVDDNRNRHYERSIVTGMGELGLLGTTVGSKYQPLSFVKYGLVAREIERVDSSYRTMLSTQKSLVIEPINNYGSEEQKHKYISRLCNGTLIGCFGSTEPNHGSNPSGMETTARWDKSKNCFVLNGTKKWISNGPVADVFLIWARSNLHKNAICCFILERGMRGISTHNMEEKYCLRLITNGYVYMRDVEVPECNLLPKSIGVQHLFNCVNNASYGIAWGALGAAEFCFHAALKYSRNRYQFGRPLASNQIIQAKFADMITEITLGLQACLRVGRLKDENRATAEMISLMKRNSTLKALTIARSCRDIFGAEGIKDTNHIIRHVMNLEVDNTYEGTHDMHALQLGRIITGLQAFVT